MKCLTLTLPEIKKYNLQKSIKIQSKQYEPIKIIGYEKYIFKRPKKKWQLKEGESVIVKHSFKKFLFLKWDSWKIIRDL